MDQGDLFRLQFPVLEQIGPDGKQRFRQGGGVREFHAFGYRQGVAGIDSGIFGITAAMAERADPVADRPAGNAVTNCRHRTGDLKAEQVAGIFRHLVQPLSLQHIRAVDPGGGNPDHDLSGLDFRHGPSGRVEVFRAAGFAELDYLHGAGKCGGHFCLMSCVGQYAGGAADLFVSSR